jgi:non-specific serine/threonine protein kinase/protein-serine/threonine kinase
VTTPADLSPAAAIRPGGEIDGIAIGSLLHKGGMALIYEARKPGIDAPLILKAPRLSHGEDPAAIVGFEMEMMILPRLQGVHAPRIYQVGDFATQPYILMERLSSPSLIMRLGDLPLPVDEVVQLAARVADALASLHQQNVIHLDIKPSNIVFRSSGEAVLIDFGLSHHAELPDLIEEEFRLPYGTAPYIAPEQVLGVRTYRRSDLFALGCLMYFFATGVRPFGDPQSLKGLKRRLWEDPMPPRALKPDIPPWFQEIVLRCLEPNPEHRTPTAAQLAFDLRHPDQVALTGRSEKLKRDGWFAARKRRGNEALVRAARKSAIASKLSSAPIIAAAIDTREADSGLAAAMRATLLRSLKDNPESRLACLNVLKQKAIGVDETHDEAGHNRHVKRLVELKHWAAPMGLADGRITFHVLEAVNPAEAILTYARLNHVDHIVLGARKETFQRRLLGSVSAEVAGHAPCSVTVVRAKNAMEAAAEAIAAEELVDEDETQP